MKINTAKENLMYGVQMAQRAVTTRNPLPILSGILFQTKNNTLKVMATDLEIGIKCNIAVTTIEEGSIVIPAKYITDIVRKLPDVPIDINIDKNNNTVVIKYSSSAEYSVNEVKLKGFSAEEFPSFPITEDKTEITIDISIVVLKEILRQVLFATSSNENKPVFTGVLFKVENNTLILVATDTHRLALRRISLPELVVQDDISVIIPGRTLSELLRIINNTEAFQSSGESDTVKIAIGSNQALFVLKDTILVSRLIEGNFPVYEQVIPKEYKSRLKLKTKELLASIERAALLTKSGNQIIKLNTQPTELSNHKQDLLSITANTEDGAIHEEIKIYLEGEPIQIAFNAGYLTDILRTISAEEIYFELNGSLSPGVIKPIAVENSVKETENYIVLVLPVRTA